MMLAGSHIPMSYEDSFQREADDERAYHAFERQYIGENMRPESIGKWEWQLMFNGATLHSDFASASREAKEMAHEMGKCVDIRFSTYYQVAPPDYWEFDPSAMGSLSRTYDVRRGRFIQSLLLTGTYPDLKKIADATNHFQRNEISRASWEINRGHQEWLTKAAREKSVGIS